MWSEAEGGEELCGVREKVMMSYVECEGEGGDELGVIVKEDVVMCCVECDGECGDELCGVREKVGDLFCVHAQSELQQTQQAHSENSRQNQELQQTIANLQAQLSDKQCVLQSLAQCQKI